MRRQALSALDPWLPTSASAQCLWPPHTFVSSLEEWGKKIEKAAPYLPPADAYVRAPLCVFHICHFLLTLWNNSCISINYIFFSHQVHAPACVQWCVSSLSCCLQCGLPSLSDFIFSDISQPSSDSSNVTSFDLTMFSHSSCVFAFLQIQKKKKTVTVFFFKN